MASDVSGAHATALKDGEPEPAPESQTDPVGVRKTTQGERQPSSGLVRGTEPGRVVPLPVQQRSGLMAVGLVAFDADTREATIRVGQAELPARLAPTLDPIVVQTVLERGELLIAQEEPDGWLLLGALRTTATPGIDVGDDYVIEARRISVKAEHGLTFQSGAAQLMLRAVGRVETIARNITARASEAHKIIGRAIHLN